MKTDQREKTIIVFGAYYEPEQIASPYLAENIREGFAGAGYRVKLYVPMPSRGISKELARAYWKKKLELKYDGRLEVHRYRMFAETENSLLRGIRYLCCNAVQLLIGLTKKDVDAVFAASTPPTQGAVVSLIRKFRKIPVFYSLQDVFPDSMLHAGMTTENSLLYKLGSKMEHFIYCNVDRIAVPSEAIHSNLLSKGVKNEKITVIPNWVNEGDVHPISKEDNKLYDELGLPKDAFYVVYAGNMGHAQDIETILDAAQRLNDENGIRFVFFGRETQCPEYQKVVRERGLKNTLVFPMFGYERVSEVYSLGDTGIVSCKAGMGQSALPSKTWSIMATARPVLASFDTNTDLERIVVQTQSGLFNAAGDVEALTNNIRWLYANRRESAAMGARGREYILEKLSKRVGVQKYVHAMKSVMGDTND